ncbi:Acetyltransferase (GNAT) family protein [Nocardioides terrae]|uniref:Acetyltransferase (GNAT) family protein n=1 Tax=Nocardioides terrae TaxID=574651 RepID=A0A1I1KK63_9ACTN|nr:GNAT family N-acetyltransferase [Nocardioides terrae]SFC60965.1 Acetyltransferase (GNAT) family protein [Nocardioides terrae]
MSDLQIRRVPLHHPDVAALVERVQEFYVERYGSRDDDPTDEADFEAPLGAFFVGYVDGAPAVSGAWRVVDDRRLGATRLAEVKRMYVVPELQRRGLARRMLAHLETTAAAAGMEALLLSTAVKQPEAIALYESSGYEPVEGFGYYGGGPLNRCYGKRLDRR